MAQSMPPCWFWMKSRYWSEIVTLSADTLSYIGQPSGQMSWPSFSSTVIRFSRSSARSSAERLASLYSGVLPLHPARMSRAAASERPAAAAGMNSLLVILYLSRKFHLQLSLEKSKSPIATVLSPVLRRQRCFPHLQATLVRMRKVPSVSCSMRQSSLSAPV